MKTYEQLGIIEINYKQEAYGDRYTYLIPVAVLESNGYSVKYSYMGTEQTKKFDYIKASDKPGYVTGERFISIGD